MARTNVWDGQRLHVREVKCPTCIFRPGNLMMLAPGRREQMIKDCLLEQITIPCHETLHTTGHTQESICRGFWDLHRRDIGLLQVAERLDLVEYD